MKIRHAKNITRIEKLFYFPKNSYKKLSQVKAKIKMFFFKTENVRVAR